MLNIEDEFEGRVRALERTGVMGPLQAGGRPDIVGIDGREYPVPNLEQMRGIFESNRELVDRKSRQGFNQLLLTPMAMPVPKLVDRVSEAVRRQAEEGTILRTKRAPADEDVPVRANTREPVWIWERVREALDTPKVVHFPKSYARDDHGGLTKAEVLQDPRLCAIPGWSVGLIEPLPVMPQPGEGRVLGGRRQLEAGSCPRDYMATMGAPEYQGETGWTHEDLLTHFVTRLATTGQVSHDRSDDNACWMLGSFMPDLMPRALVVPTGNWHSAAGRRLYLGAHRTGNHFRQCVARTVVRLQG